MFCDDCKKQLATVHLMRIANGQKVELHLCVPCAAQRNLQIFPIPFVPGFVIKPTLPPFPLQGQESRRCAGCGYNWQEFVSTGFLGCVSCYQSFSDLLGQLIAKNQGQVRHQGKFPSKGSGPLRIRREIVNLRSQLEKAIQGEDFEKAVQLRDQIHELEQQVK